MALVLLALVAGLAAGYARGGRLRRLTNHPPVRSRLVLTALGLYAVGVAGSWAWEPLLPTMTALCWFTIGFYAWLNRGHHGARLIALGLAANGLVIMLNGAMPVSTNAQERAGATPEASAEPAEEAGRVTAIGDGTTLPFLGKVVPVAFPPRPEVVSPGDIAVAAGIAAALATAMTGRRAGTAGARRTDTTSASTGHGPGHPAPRRRPADARPGRRPAPATAGAGPAGPPPPPPADGDDRHTRESTTVRPERPAERATMDPDVTADAEPGSPRVTA